MLTQALTLITVCLCVLLQPLKPISWYDFQQRNEKHEYHDLYGKGPTAKGGEVSQEGIEISESSPWTNLTNNPFSLPLSQKTQLSIYFAFNVSTWPFTLLEVWSEGLNRPFALVSLSSGLEVQLCVPVEDECTYKQRADELHSGMLLTISDGPGLGQTFRLSISNVYLNISTKTTNMTAPITLRFPGWNQRMSLYILGVVSGLLNDLYYVAKMYHSEVYPPITCHYCIDAANLECLLGMRPKPLVGSPREYRCPCIWPFKYSDEARECQFPSLFGCDSKCDLHCNNNGDRCMSCKAPFVPHESDGDFVRCGCPPGTAFDPSTSFCTRTTREGCAGGCLGECDINDAHRCAYGCKRNYDSSREEGDFRKCDCRYGRGYEESTRSCIELGKTCDKRCYRYCDKRYPQKCYEHCNNDLVLVKDGDMGLCVCPNHYAYQDSSISCIPIYNHCERGCVQCSWYDESRCYGPCKESFVPVEENGELHYCKCPRWTNYQKTKDTCARITADACGYSCMGACSVNSKQSCAEGCRYSFIKKWFDGDFFSCVCPPNTALRDNHCRELTETNCPPGCVGPCNPSGQCSFPCKPTYVAKPADQEFVDCVCPEGSKVNEETKLCEPTSSVWLYVLTPSLTFVGVSAIILVICCVRKRKRAIADDDNTQRLSNSREAEEKVGTHNLRQPHDREETEDTAKAPIREVKLGSGSESCPVCHDKPPVLANNCGHVLCESCYANMLKANRPCPTCGTRLSPGTKLTS